jgi:hypothetical protein
VQKAGLEKRMLCILQEERFAFFLLTLSLKCGFRYFVHPLAMTVKVKDECKKR